MSNCSAISITTLRWPAKQVSCQRYPLAYVDVRYVLLKFWVLMVEDHPARPKRWRRRCRLSSRRRSSPDHGRRGCLRRRSGDRSGKTLRHRGFQNVVLTLVNESVRSSLPGSFVSAPDLALPEQSTSNLGSGLTIHPCRRKPSCGWQKHRSRTVAGPFSGRSARSASTWWTEKRLCVPFHVNGT